MAIEDAGRVVVPWPCLYRRDLGKKHSYNELVDRLSPEVRKDMVLRMSAWTLRGVWYLNECEEGDGDSKVMVVYV